MDADLVVDDEFQPRQPHASVRQPGERERLVGGAHVHHDLDVDVWHALLLGLLDVEVQQARVHITGVALGA